MSMFNDIDWTMKGNYNECFSYNEVHATLWWPRFFSRRKEKNGTERKNYKPARTVEFYCRFHVFQFRRQRTSSLQSFRCIGSGILDKHKCWTMYDSLQSRILRTQSLLFRTITSANQLSIYGAIADNTWSIIFKPGEIHCESDLGSLYRKLELEEVNTLSTSTWDGCSSIERSTAWSPREIRKSIKRDKGFSDLWVRWIHEEGLYWTILPNNSRREWCFWRNERIVQRVHASSWWPRFFSTYWVDSWTHEDRSSPSSQSHVVLINWEMRYRYRQHQETDLIPGLWYPEAQYATWRNFDKTKKTLTKTLRWWVIQALNNHTQ